MLNNSGLWGKSPKLYTPPTCTCVRRITYNVCTPYIYTARMEGHNYNRAQRIAYIAERGEQRIPTVNGDWQAQPVCVSRFVTVMLHPQSPLLGEGMW